MNASMLRTLARRPICRQCLLQQRRMASDLPAPPLLLKIRADLKQAMKDKDAAKLSVLRNVLSDVTNAAKTKAAVQTDMQLLALLRKRAQASKDAAADARNAKREDLWEKENAQVAVLEGYASNVETVGEEEIKGVLQEVIGRLRTDGNAPNAGNVLKEVFKQGGPLEGKPVDRSQVAVLVKGML